MVIKSSLSVTVPTISVPSFVFKSATEELSDNPLLISAERPKSLSVSLKNYRLLSQQLALGLRRSGFQDGDRILLASPNSVYTPIVFMGTVMAGGIFVGVQPSYDMSDLVRQVQQTTPRFVLVADFFSERIKDVAQILNYPNDKLLRFDEDITGNSNGSQHRHWTEIFAEAEAARQFEWQNFRTREEANKTASLIYSSGTSGHPKGVEMTHHQLVSAVAMNMRFHIARLATRIPAGIMDRPLLVYMSLAQVVGQSVACILFPLLGVPVLIASKYDFVSVQRYIINLRLTALIINPSFAVALMKDDALRKSVPEMKSLQAMVMIGSPIGNNLCEEYVRFWKEQTGQRMIIRFGYGMTELGGGISGWPRVGKKRAPGYYLYPGVEAKVMNLDGSHEVASGKEGELWIRGANVAKGYWQNREATAASFKEGWLLTGDIAFIDGDGTIFVVSRKADLVDTALGAVAPYHLEQILILHPAIKEAVICGVPDPANRDRKLVRAYIVRKDGHSIEAEEVEQYLRANAPHLPQIDGGVAFPAGIPKTTVNGPASN